MMIKDTDMKNFEKVVDANDPDFEKKSVKSLEDDGLVVITNLIDKNTLEEICSDAEEVLKTPSTRGSYGYITKDPHKRMYDGFLFSKHTVNTVANSKIIKIIEDYLDQEVVMTECFLKQDLGTNVSYFPYHRHTGRDLTVESNITKQTGNKFGCGVMFYMHETNNGAFCYAPGSHKTPIISDISLLEHDPDKNNWQLILQQVDPIITKNLHRIIGPKGSIVIFNEAGWHGPEQPVTSQRTVILSGYQSKRFSENRTRTAIPILVSNIETLTETQRRAIGFSSGSRTNFKNYHMRNGEITIIDKIYDFSIEKLFALKRLKQKIKGL